MVYVTACDLKKSFIVDMAITVVGSLHIPIRT